MQSSSWYTLVPRKSRQPQAAGPVTCNQCGNLGDAELSPAIKIVIHPHSLAAILCVNRLQPL